MSFELRVASQQLVFLVTLGSGGGGDSKHVNADFRDPGIRLTSSSYLGVRSAYSTAMSSGSGLCPFLCSDHASCLCYLEAREVGGLTNVS